jgi:hypothetical protein
MRNRDDGSNETGAEYPPRDSGHNAVIVRKLSEFSAGATDGPAYAFLSAVEGEEKHAIR